MTSIWTPGQINKQLEAAVLNNLRVKPMDSQELYDCIFSSISEFCELRSEDLKLLPNTINNLIALGNVGVRSRPIAKNSHKLELELFSAS